MCIFFLFKTVFAHLAKQSTVLSQLCEGQSVKVLNMMFFQIAFENSYHVGGDHLWFKLALCSEALPKFLCFGCLREEQVYCEAKKKNKPKDGMICAS